MYKYMVAVNTLSTGCSRKKLHKVCHVIDFKPFVLGLRCLHRNAYQTGIK